MVNIINSPVFRLIKTIGIDKMPVFPGGHKKPLGLKK
jgi:hypothetical protein